MQSGLSEEKFAEPTFSDIRMNMNLIEASRSCNKKTDSIHVYSKLPLLEFTIDHFSKVSSAAIIFGQFTQSLKQPGKCSGKMVVNNGNTIGYEDKHKIKCRMASSISCEGVYHPSTAVNKYK
ncbi:hypothetical protein VNO80_15183 [Phaseolus coccineus]|uniref:Uncharacterized protein n=1 Tax=Phaseolus coccineus TaxID=3886 RepID=A0AAN9MJV1_PHACN